MLYPQFGGPTMCGGHYGFNGKMCQWVVTHNENHVTARIYGDYRYEGKSYTYPTRRDALIALADMVFA